MLGDMLARCFEQEPASPQFWLTDDEGEPVSVAYYAPERMTEETWNLYLIAVHPQHRGRRRGSALSHQVEAALYPVKIGTPMFEQCRWLNEPDRWALLPDGLAVTTNRATDFWRETHYGFTRDNGHFFGREVPGGFTASLRVKAQYESLYDQAGIMVRLDDETWIKAGVELSDGEALLSSVLTVGRSDWATGPFHGDASDFLIRVTVDRGVLRLQASTDGLRWPLVRLCPFPKAERYLVGPMCCTPERAGLEVLFSDLAITPPTGRALHDLS